MLKAIFRLITVAAPTRTVFLILHSLAKGMANHVTFLNEFLECKGYYKQEMITPFLLPINYGERVKKSPRFQKDVFG